MVEREQLPSGEQEPKPEAPKRRRTHWRGPDGLNSQQRMFIGFLMENGADAVAAARSAGYAHPRVAGPRLARNPAVKAIIASELAGFALRRHEVLARLSEIATADLGRHLRIGPDGALEIHVDPSQTYAVKSVTVGPRGTKIELLDKLAALEKLARYHRLFEDAAQTDAARDLVAELDAANKLYEAEQRDENSRA